MRFGMSPCTSCTDSSHGRVLLTRGNSAVHRKRRFRMGWSVSALLSLLSTCSIMEASQAQLTTKHSRPAVSRR